MRVLVLSTLYPSPANPVFGVFVHQQVQALARRGIDVRVISPVPWAPALLAQINPKWRMYHAIPQQGALDGIQISYPRFLQFPRSLFYASSGKRLLYSIAQLVDLTYGVFPFDVLHAHVALPAGYAAMKIAEAYAKPLVVTVHGQDLQTTVKLNSACASAVGEVLIGATQVVFVSRKLHGLAVSLFGNRSNWRVVPNGTTALSRVRRPSLRTASPPLILSVSNLIRSKGIDLNLRAVKEILPKYPDLHYLIIGDGPERPNLVALTQELGLQEHVTFLGRRPHDEVMAAMATCSIFSLPSWQEGFGIVYLEALACGKPVIGCKGEGLADFVVDGVHGRLVARQALDELVDAMDDLLSNPARAQEMGERGQQMVSQEYTWDHNAATMARIYEGLVGRQGNGARKLFAPEPVRSVM
ncbi:MAG: glycosyltransferase family 4 protein [Bacillota bacterium]